MLDGAAPYAFAPPYASQSDTGGDLAARSIGARAERSGPLLEEVFGRLSVLVMRGYSNGEDQGAVKRGRLWLQDNGREDSLVDQSLGHGSGQLAAKDTEYRTARAGYGRSDYG
ncbi:hypothetical protein V494_05870 [Pseudogymnoascus sp. VKM F-4513 (FW-928)]|nr:hypothetical protein V494_05870 [Pseudogymnoascus sp. VKM F-4513 (FW-928)]